MQSNDSNDNTNGNNDINNNHEELNKLPENIIEKLQANAFRNLCLHLQERSDLVTNIDLMTISGFCRNCLAKWMVIEARRLVDTNYLDNNESITTPTYNNHDSSKRTIDLLNSFGYNDAAEIVYGTTYDEWKKRHQTKATKEQLEKYNASIPIHSVFDPQLLEPRITSSSFETNTTDNNDTTNMKSTINQQQRRQQGAPIIADNSKINLSSNVCCENMDQIVRVGDTNTTPSTTQQQQQQQVSNGTIETYQPPSISDILRDRFSSTQGKISLNIGVLTISDRAYKNEYTTGDLSGPAVQDTIESLLAGMSNNNDNSMSQNLDITYTKSIVPDEVPTIQQQIQEWSSGTTNQIEVIITTGGTGLSPRDRTPEAIRGIPTFIECSGLMNFITNETSKLQPLSCLSRGIAGILNSSCFVVTLPGNPKAITEMMPLLFPLVLHAIADLRAQ